MNLESASVSVDGVGMRPMLTEARIAKCDPPNLDTIEARSGVQSGRLTSGAPAAVILSGRAASELASARRRGARAEVASWTVQKNRIVVESVMVPGSRKNTPADRRAAQLARLRRP